MASEQLELFPDDFAKPTTPGPYERPDSFDGHSNEWLWAGLCEAEVLAGTILTAETAAALIEMTARLLIGETRDEASARALPLLRELAHRMPAIVAGRDSDVAGLDEIFARLEAGLSETRSWLFRRGGSRWLDGSRHHVRVAASLLGAVKHYVTMQTLSTRLNLAR